MSACHLFVLFCFVRSSAVVTKPNRINTQPSTVYTFHFFPIDKTKRIDCDAIYYTKYCNKDPGKSSLSKFVLVDDESRVAMITDAECLMGGLCSPPSAAAAAADIETYAMRIEMNRWDLSDRVGFHFVFRLLREICKWHGNECEWTNAIRAIGNLLISTNICSWIGLLSHAFSNLALLVYGFNFRCVICVPFLIPSTHQSINIELMREIW